MQKYWATFGNDDHAPLFRVGLLLAGYFSVSLFILTITGKDGPSDPAQAGKSLWQRNNCISCHSLVGLGGHLGPDLTNAFSRRGEGYIRYVLNHGSKKMPAFHLSPAEQNALIAYLKAIDSTSIYPLKRHDAPVFGQSKTGPYPY
ncbi:MAG: cytochrome c [Saprospirales bacterium]|nr:cytochrome c [Saprospirales bacterium]